MEADDRHVRYLRGFMSPVDQARYEALVSRRMDLAGALAARLESGEVWDNEMAARARALLSVHEAWSELLPDDIDAELRLDLLPPLSRPGKEPLLRPAEQPEVIRLVNLLLVTAIRDGIDVVEILLEQGSLAVWAIDDDGRREMLRAPGRVFGQVMHRLKRLAEVDPEAVELAQHGRIPLLHDGRSYEIEATFQPADAGEIATLVITHL